MSYLPPHQDMLKSASEGRQFLSTNTENRMEHDQSSYDRHGRTISVDPAFLTHENVLFAEHTANQSIQDSNSTSSFEFDLDNLVRFECQMFKANR